jgi:phage tail protein X
VSYILLSPTIRTSVVDMTNTQALTVGTRVVDAVAMRVYGRSTEGTVVALLTATDGTISADVLWDNDPSGMPEAVWADELTVVVR